MHNVLNEDCFFVFAMQHGKSFPANSREKAEIKQLLKLGKNCEMLSDSAVLVCFEELGKVIS